MTSDEIIDQFPFLRSPAALAIADSNGAWKSRPHLDLINRKLMSVAFGEIDRLGVHIPFQHGKTKLCSEYFSAWVLLLFPWMRIILCSHSERYSGTIGSRVRDIIARFGPSLGINLKQDTKSKNEWNIDSRGPFDGGMVCKGYRGDINGRACDLLLFDDVLKNAEQAMSQVILDSQWEFYQTVAFSRLGPKAPIVFVTTRWVSKDLPGRVYTEAKETGEKWEVINFKAIAEKDDPLGRQPGEALWPERVPLKRLEMIRQKRGRWFSACWQQTPIEEQGLHFRPRPTKDTKGWPVYTNIGDAWSLPFGFSRRIFLHSQTPILIGVDWALGKKKTSDFTCFLVAALCQVDMAGMLTPKGYLLILDCINERIRKEENAKRLAELCDMYQPAIVAGDDDNIAETMELECRRYHEIPQILRLPIKNKAKLLRATAAIIRGESGGIFLPQKAIWLDEVCDRLAEFTGDDGGVDDIPDALGILGRVADRFHQPAPHAPEEPQTGPVSRRRPWRHGFLSRSSS